MGGYMLVTVLTSSYILFVSCDGTYIVPEILPIQPPLEATVRRWWINKAPAFQPVKPLGYQGNGNVKHYFKYNALSNAPMWQRRLVRSPSEDVIQRMHHYISAMELPLLDIGVPYTPPKRSLGSGLHPALSCDLCQLVCPPCGRTSYAALADYLAWKPQTLPIIKERPSPELIENKDSTRTPVATVTHPVESPDNEDQETTIDIHFDVNITKTSLT